MENNTPFPARPGLAVMALFAVFITAMYLPFVLCGGLTSDDWSVGYLGLIAHSLRDVYREDFLSFSNRPLAPLYYGLVSRFGGWFVGYALTGIVQWVFAVFIIASVVRQRFGDRAGAVFMAFALLPTFSTTVMFSPGMQSIGATSILLWAVSFRLLDRATVRANVRLVYAAALCITVMLALYEVALPLLALSLAWPLIGSDRPLTAARKDRIFRINAVLIGGAVLLMLIYQKIIAPHYFGDISRMRANALGPMAMTTVRNCFVIMKILCAQGPALMLRALMDMARHPAGVGLLMGLVAMAVLARLLSMPEKPTLPVPPRLWLVGASLAAGLFALALMHAGAQATPTIKGYTNRGLASLSIMLPLMIAFAVDALRKKAPRAAHAVALILFAGYAAGFIVQSQNYIAAARIREQVYTAIMSEIAQRPATIILADVPNFLPRNFNDEAVFTDDLADFRIMLAVRTQGKLMGTLITRKKICAKDRRIVIDGDTVNVDNDTPLSLKNAVFYTYGGDGQPPQFIPVTGGDDLRKIIASYGDCAGIGKNP